MPRIQPDMVTAMTSMGGMGSVIGHGGGPYLGGHGEASRQISGWKTGNWDDSRGTNFCYRTFSTGKNEDNGGSLYTSGWYKNDSHPE